MMDQPPVSVIVNTLDRADPLDKLLRSLRQVTYPSFEVVVVAGPSSDHTDEILGRFAGDIKVLRCPEPNLSMSRNIGIAGSAADFVAFIDDDAVPEPQWLDELMAGFTADEVVAVGGLVYDHTGHSLQCSHTGADRFGNARPLYPVPLDALAFPGSLMFPYVPGGNAVYRKDPVLAVGGFDEEFEYYLEETDLCVRLIDRGWALRQIDGGAIHHKFLSSSVRTPNKVLKDRYAVVKNKIYFSLVNGSEFHPLAAIMEDDAHFTRAHRADVQWHLERRNMTDEEAAVSIATIERGWSAGLAAGHRGRVALGFGPSSVDRPPPTPFLTFATLRSTTPRRRLCFVSQTIPPTVIGGIGRYFLDLARELAERGHEVHLVTTAEDHDTVDLEQGVWVHRVLKTGAPLDPGDGGVPHRIAANADAVAAEVARIADRTPLDLVYAAMWDVEQLAVMRRTEIPVVTALVTTFAITLRTRPEWAADDEFMAHFGRPMLELEVEVLEHSDVLHAISRAITVDVAATSGVELGDKRVVVAPIGAVDHFGRGITGDRLHGATQGPMILFVGRFEKRKGVDLLLGAAPGLMAAHPTARLVLVGRNDLAGEDGVPYAVAFRNRHGDEPWFDRVDVRGEVDDEELWRLYGAADLLVAPSRFESFGLIYVEAMMASLPVVALDRGAAPEIVEQGRTGLLVGDSADAVGGAITMLLADPSLRAELGANGRRVYAERFTVAAMADRSLAVFDEAVRVAATRPRIGAGGDVSGAIAAADVDLATP